MSGFFFFHSMLSSSACTVISGLSLWSCFCWKPDFKTKLVFTHDHDECGSPKTENKLLSGKCKLIEWLCRGGSFNFFQQYLVPFVLFLFVFKGCCRLNLELTLFSRLQQLYQRTSYSSFSSCCFFHLWNIYFMRSLKKRRRVKGVLFPQGSKSLVHFSSVCWSLDWSRGSFKWL